MLEKIVLFGSVVLSSTVLANTITDVGVGDTPDYLPSHYDPASNEPAWKLSSTCVDINNKGQAACQATAVGPTYGCKWRNAQKCHSSVTQVHRWTGTDLLRLSRAGAVRDVPLSMNERGHIAGYSYESAVYPTAGNNGRIWISPTRIKVKPSIVTSVNNRGDYIEQKLAVPGGTRVYSAKVFDRTGLEMTFPGSLTLPFVINNKREVIGGQIIQTYANEFQSGTGNERAEVSGIGWMLSQSDVDALPLTPVGEFDVDGRSYWALRFLRDTPFANNRTWVNDINDEGDFVGQNNFGGLFSGALCTREGETHYTDIFGTPRTLPWSCEGTNYVGGTYAGGKAFKGLNNIGDAVGIFTPGVYSYTYQPTTHPWVWLVNQNGGWDEYNVNDLLPANSGYTVISVNDINDSRDVVGTCLTPFGETHGCIIHLTDQPVPVDTKKPFVRIDTDLTNTLSGTVKIDVTAWDKRSKMNLVVYKIGNKRIGSDYTRPYSIDLDTTTLANGKHNFRVRAYDKSGNVKVKTVPFTVLNQAAPPVIPPSTGILAEGEGIITASGVDYIEVDGVVVHYTASTTFKFNEVSGIEPGFPVQYKGTQDENAVITADYIEIN